MKTDEDYLHAPKMIAWKASILDAGCTIHSLNPLHLFHKPNGELLFALLSVDISAPDGSKLPSIVFLRGHACIVIPQIINKKTDQKRYLMVQQRRVVNGALNLEFPAGMLDCEVNNPSGIAIKEMLEETGLTITKEALFSLEDSILYSSPGGSDEGIYYFGCSIPLDDEKIQLLEGQLHGNSSENERIKLTLKTKNEAERETCSLQVRLGLFLFERYCSTHNLSY